MNADARLIALAIGALALTLAIGAYVTNRPFTPVDIASIALRGEATPLAILFTRSGYWQALAGVFIVVFSLCMVFRRDLTFVIALAATQVLSQLAVDGIKLIFKRTRPDEWLFHQELGYSFPSGHATSTIVVFGGLLLLLWSTPVPRPFRRRRRSGSRSGSSGFRGRGWHSAPTTVPTSSAGCCSASPGCA